MKNQKYCWKPSLVCYLLIFLSLAACNKGSSADEPTIKEGWELVFEDNFDGTDYNPAYWTSYQTQSWAANWNAYVVPEDRSLAKVEGGILHLRARWNDETNLPETGAIQTLNKFSFTYGKLEVRAKFSRMGKGAWPAIWLMPQTPVYAGWPAGGEIDVMEHLNAENIVFIRLSIKISLLV